MIAPACLSLATSLLTASACSFDGRRGGCLLGITEEFTFSRWQMKLRSTPGASYGLHANTSMFALRNSSNLSFSYKGSLTPTWKNFSRSSAIVILSNSSHFTSSTSTSKDNSGGLNCYNPLSVVAVGSTSGRCCIATTRHCRTATWFPTISNTLPPDGYFTF